MIYDPYGHSTKRVPAKTIVGGYGRLQVMESLQEWDNPDDLAREEGLTVYDDVVRDLHVKSVWNTRILALRGCNRQWHPARGTEADDNRPLEYVQWMFEEAMHRSLSSVCEQVHRSATKNGYAVQELIWAHDYPKGDFKGATVLVDIRDVDPDRVILKPDGVYLKDFWSDTVGKKQHPRKFWVIPFQPEYETPYGTSLFQEIKWYVWFKKSGFKFWLVFLEKFGMPTVQGTIPEGYTDTDNEVVKLKEVLSTIRGREAITIPAGFEVSLLEAAKAGQAGYETLIAICNREISKAILGQTLTAEEGMSSGSYAQSKVHDSVRGDILISDGEWFDAALNFGPVVWALDYNFTLEKYPYLKTETQPGEDLNALAERDTKLLSAGVTFPMSYFYDTYNIPEPQDGEAVVGVASPSPVSSPGAAADLPPQSPAQPLTTGIGNKKELFAEDEKRRAVTDTLYENALEQGTPVYIQSFLEPFRSAKSFEEVQALALDPSLFADYLSRVLVTASLLGRVTMRMRMNASVTGKPENFSDFSQLGNAFPNCGIDHTSGHFYKTSEIETFEDPIPPFPVLEGYDLEGGILGDVITPEEAAEFIRQKDVMTPEEYAALSTEAKRAAFAIARVEDERVAELVKDVLEEAVANGDTFETFRQAVEGVFATYGVDEVNTHHLETVFRTNIQTAYHQAAWQQLHDPALGDLIAFLRYDAIDDSRTRPTHRAVDGVTLPVDDPFWETWWPPNGFRCRCDVIPITKYEAERRGITASENVPTHVTDTSGTKPKLLKVEPDDGFSGSPKVGKGVQKPKPSIDYTKGVEASFKRQGKDEKGQTVYGSDNGLEVRFDKIGANLYARVYHKGSGKEIFGINQSPIKNQRDFLKDVAAIGANYNFNVSDSQLLEMPQDVNDRLFRDLSKAFSNNRKI